MLMYFGSDRSYLVLQGIVRFWVQEDTGLGVSHEDDRILLLRCVFVSGLTRTALT